MYKIILSLFILSSIAIAAPAQAQDYNYKFVACSYNFPNGVQNVISKVFYSESEDYRAMREAFYNYIRDNMPEEKVKLRQCKVEDSRTEREANKERGWYISDARESRRYFVRTTNFKYRD